MISQHTSWNSVPTELHDIVLSFLGVGHILLLACTSRYNYHLGKSHICARVADMYSHWSLNTAFVDFMRLRNVVFSGSAILALLEPNILVPNDLDGYVPLGTMDLVRDFLLNHTPYVQFVKPRMVGNQDSADGYVCDGTSDTGVRSVHFFRHPTTHAVLNFTETTTSNPTAAIFKFHSTFVMNYLTHDALVCAYPLMIMDHVGLINTNTVDLSPRTHQCMLKYSLRGMQALDRARDWQGAPHDCHTYPYCSQCSRTISDKCCMRVALSCTPGASYNIMDPSLTWRLASRYTCDNVKREHPQLGFVAWEEEDD